MISDIYQSNFLVIDLGYDNVVDFYGRTKEIGIKYIKKEACFFKYKGLKYKKLLFTNENNIVIETYKEENGVAWKDTYDNRSSIIVSNYCTKDRTGISACRRSWCRRCSYQ
ncbi:MAG: hypothetical protein HFG34_13470 [Eubacterium sp.]|nr:hypothetical protein [Eubacterium sp.]